MKILDRIEKHRMLRRADNIIRNARRPVCMREHLNRPHVQSNHLISYPVPKPKTPPSPEYGIGPFYVACVISMVALVAYVNFHEQEQAANPPPVDDDFVRQMDAASGQAGEYVPE